MFTEYYVGPTEFCFSKFMNALFSNSVIILFRKITEEILNGKLYWKSLLKILTEEILSGKLHFCAMNKYTCEYFSNILLRIATSAPKDKHFEIFGKSRHWRYFKEFHWIPGFAHCHVKVTLESMCLTWIIFYDKLLSQKQKCCVLRVLIFANAWLLHSSCEWLFATFSNCSIGSQFSSFRSVQITVFFPSSTLIQFENIQNLPPSQLESQKFCSYLSSRMSFKKFFVRTKFRASGPGLR